MEKNILNEQILRMREIMGINESAKDQFKKDLQNDPDYKEFKDKAIVPGKNGGIDYSYGVVNPDNDPFINKTSQDDDTDELEEGTLYNISGVSYDEMAKAEIGSIVGDLNKIAPYVLEIGDKVKMRADGAVEVSDEGRIVRIFKSADSFLTQIGYKAISVNEDFDDTNKHHIEESAYDQSHGSPYDRGHADAYYGRSRNPHKWPEGTGHGEKVTDLTPEEIEAYNAGYDDCDDRKDWGMDENTKMETGSVGIISRRGKMMPAYFQNFGLSVAGDLVEFDNNGKLLKKGGGYPEGGFKKYETVDELEKDICANYNEMLEMFKTMAPTEVELGENESSYQIIKNAVNCDLY